jgi:outer membrane translocation and assembly module TamA
MGIIMRVMKPWILAVAALLSVLATAQDQSSCPGIRRRVLTTNCGSGDVKRDISVHVATLDASDAGGTSTYSPAGSGGYASAGSRVGPEVMADTVAHVEERQYRSCDVSLEIIERVRDSFQRLGYFCADVEPLAGRQTGKNEYKINIHVHPGEQYRVGEIKFTGATLLSADELTSALHLKSNSLFNTESVRRGLENIQKSYSKKGHASVTAIPIASVDEKDRKIALEIKINESGATQ